MKHTADAVRRWFLRCWETDPLIMVCTIILMVLIVIMIFTGSFSN